MSLVPCVTFQMLIFIPFISRILLLFKKNVIHSIPGKKASMDTTTHV